MSAVLLFSGARQASGQETSTDWAWTKMIDVDSLEIAYLFYRKAEGESGGIVFKLTNRNDYAVRYRFTAIFREGTGQVEQIVSGTIDPRSILTGEDAGLFFVPFPDGRSIDEVGLRGYRADRIIR